ncbi:DUF5995 family protein [Paenibacillus sp. BSR1-1]|uniref:DUF5995 family protein n=1 Tax=Paenibacillus sp. BSR1-1 TaxID=3020845 RepID=UPI0025B1C652|nr:DUF5995 family protein [Paenibacillus sp. BSR1-1]MDN3016412.1 DUF5995 family protein [Paenibacillus sp. BSR1-1]
MELVSNTPIDSINQVIDMMTEELDIFQKCGDHRVVFHRVYLLMTKEMKRRLSSDFFEDPVWMERVLVGFAHYYFNAVNSYKIGLPCPPAWELAFRQASKKQGFVLQDALLGINAHINSDLPMVMYNILNEECAWPDARRMLHRRQDHERINKVLTDLMDLVQDELSYYYARFIRVIDYVMGRKDETLSSLIMAHCRSNVWYNTELLLNASDEEHRDIQRRLIEKDALSIGLKVSNAFPFKITKFIAPLTRRNRWF